ncbi:MAG: radical SAM protein [bacterium]
MKSITLINPPAPWLINQRSHHPLGILALAGFLRENGCEVVIADLAGEDERDIPESDCYGITAVTPQILIAEKICREIKKRNAGAVVILGGIHASVLPEETLGRFGFDALVAGEGEGALLDIVSGREFSAIGNLAWRDGGKITINSKRPLIKSLDALPFPAYDLIDVTSYSPTGIRNMMTMTTSRGCPFRCAFCTHTYISGGKYRAMSAGRVVEEVEYIIDRFGITAFSFQDELFTANRKRFLELCDAFGRLGIEWKFLSRVDRMDCDMMKAAVEAGAFQVSVGVESGSQTILDNLEKGIKKEDTAKALAAAREAGIKTFAFMMVNCPGETDGTVEETIEFLKENPADEYALMMYVPFPGDKVWSGPEEFGFVIPPDYGQYQYLNRSGMGISFMKDKEKAEKRFRRLAGFLGEKTSFHRDRGVVGG